MGSKTIVEEKKMEEAIKNIPKDSFTVLDFIEGFRNMYLKIGKDLLKGLGFSEVKEDTQ